MTLGNMRDLIHGRPNWRRPINSIVASSQNNPEAMQFLHTKSYPII
jgi:hypothetical protein